MAVVSKFIANYNIHVPAFCLELEFKSFLEHKTTVIHCGRIIVLFLSNYDVLNLILSGGMLQFPIHVNIRKLPLFQNQHFSSCFKRLICVWTHVDVSGL